VDYEIVVYGYCPTLESIIQRIPKCDRVIDLGCSIQAEPDVYLLVVCIKGYLAG